MSKYDSIIIGAGMSGLAAGIRLAHFGQRVCMLERHYAVGGLNSYYRLGRRNYDVGLHAVTNYRPKGDKRGPLARLLRQLRFAWEDFGLAPQVGSRIAFPGVALDFNNDSALLEAEVAKNFPREIDNFRRLQAEILDYDGIEAPKARASARDIVGRTIGDPLLIEMLFCPIMLYGSASERDMEFGQFSILFRSIFQEGLARPISGIRMILKKLVQRFKLLGGELRLRAGVQRITVEGGEVREIVLDDGSALSARKILSSAGWCETMRMCDVGKIVEPDESGQLSFIESVSTLNVEPRDLGYKHTMVFFNDSERFDWQRPDELADVRSGVVCSPNNFCYDSASVAGEGTMRLTALANFTRWTSLDESAYRQEKQRWYERMVASAVRFIPDFRPHVVDVDVFTPKTIRRFTGHDNGAVYGAPKKRYDGTTPLKNLFICGTDQGLVGIIGALISGITMANKHLLARE
jgi:phytoene dehydrogenase-like protein